jgi:tetratricopeptide (TPR) repeat protein
MYYRQALEIECLHLPNDHPRIGVTYNHLGNVFRKRKDMKEAMKYYEQAELIFGQRLPSHHPYTAYCWSCMAFVYLYQGEIKKAQEYHEKALEIYRRILPSDHINIKISEKNSKCTDFQKINDTYVKICAQV